MSQTVKHLSAMLETWVRSLGREYPLEKEMATHSSTLAWKIPWTEEPGSLWGCKELDMTQRLYFILLYFKLNQMLEVFGCATIRESLIKFSQWQIVTTITNTGKKRKNFFLCDRTP